MGLLSNSSDSGPGEKLKAALQQKSGFLCLFFFAGGLIYLGYIIHSSFDNQTYFSENALLPGLVDEEFMNENDIYNFLNRFKAYAGSSTSKDRTLSLNNLKQIENEFISVGLETYVQNFTFKDPLTFSEAKRGHNIFGFVRSSRGASIEATVIAVNYGRENLLALSIILALAKHCRDQVYWAKDLIFVLVEHGEIGILAWLNAYYERQNEYLSASSLMAHGGSIQSAVVLDTFEIGENIKSKVDVQINMLNGQLPNLDFVNLAVRMLEKQNMLPTVHGLGREDLWGLNKDQSFWHLANTAVQSILAQARSQPKGLHAIFGAFGIEALTIKPSNEGIRIPGLNLAQVLEGMLRSVNNLLEKFHQSYFFYILTSTHNYISIGIYMPVIEGILLSCLLKACIIWINLNDTKDDSQPALAEKINYSKVISYLVVSHLCGIIFCFALELSSFAPILREIYKNNILPIGFTLMAVILCLPKALNTKKGNLEDYAPTLHLVYCFSLIELALIVGVTAVLNFGLGFLLSISFIPLFLLMSPNSLKKFRRILNYFLIVFTNPLFVLCIWNLLFALQAAYSKPQPVDFGQILKKTYASTGQIIRRTILDAYVFNSWQFTLFTIGLIPVWVSAVFSLC